jgi:hypothetical protein
MSKNGSDPSKCRSTNVKEGIVEKWGESLHAEKQNPDNRLTIFVFEEERVAEMSPGGGWVCREKKVQMPAGI